MVTLSFGLANSTLTSVPWAALHSQNLFFREALKIVLTCQSLFMEELRKSYVGMILWFLTLMFSSIFITFNKPLYINIIVNKVDTVCLRFLTTISILSLLRVFLQAELAEIVIYSPILCYAVFKFLAF